MRRNPFRILSLIIVCACLFAYVVNSTLRNETHDLTIKRADDSHVTLQVEIADSPLERQKGLMGRTDLPDGHGMLFVFPTEVIQSFWMRNTPLFLDMLFIDDNGTIVHIHRKARPFDDTPISSRKPTRYVLEIKGGEAAHFKIKVGDQVVKR